MRDPEPGQSDAEKAAAGRSRDDAELHRRLEALKADLGEVRQDQAAEARAGSSRESASALATGMRAASEHVAGVLVGAALGYGLDMYLGTKPVLLIVLLMGGMAAGFLNVYRLGARPSRRSGDETGPKA